MCYSVLLALACLVGTPVKAQFPPGVCEPVECCVEDCCGEGTSWNSATGRCDVDPESPGFTGTHSPEYDSECKTIDQWGCCEGECCGAGTRFDLTINYCVLNTGLVPDVPPQCCDPDAFILCFIGTAQCCLDGTWSCPNGFTNEYLCAGEVTTGPFSKACDQAGAAGCPKDLQVCPDGFGVSRDPKNNCEFFPCDCCDPATEPGKFDNPLCIDGYVCCPNGDWSCGIGDGTAPCGNLTVEIGLESGVGRICETKVQCTKDAFVCPDGSTVARDPANNCEFFPCKDTAPTLSPIDPNGLGPEIKPPLPCCDPDAFKYCFVGTAACCLDGNSWPCPNGTTGVYLCAGEETTGPFLEPATTNLCPDAPKTSSPAPAEARLFGIQTMVANSSHARTWRREHVRMTYGHARTALLCDGIPQTTASSSRVAVSLPSSRISLEIQHALKDKETYAAPTESGYAAIPMDPSPATAKTPRAHSVKRVNFRAAILPSSRALKLTQSAEKASLAVPMATGHAALVMEGPFLVAPMLS